MVIVYVSSVFLLQNHCLMHLLRPLWRVRTVIPGAHLYAGVTCTREQAF